MPQDPEWARLRKEFLDSPTPRSIPREIGKAVIPGNRLTLTIIGALFMAIGGFLSANFFPSDFRSQWRLDHGPTATVPGTILSVKATNLSINRRKVMENRFRYSPRHQSSREGTAHTTGNYWSAGSAVKVRYLLDDPAIAAPVGGRIWRNTAPMLAVLLFPLGGLALVITSQIGAARRKDILRNGLLAAAAIESIEETIVKINNAPQFKVTLVQQNNRARIVRRIHEEDTILHLYEKMKRRRPVQILHDRRKPARLLFPGSWKR